MNISKEREALVQERDFLTKRWSEVDRMIKLIDHMATRQVVVNDKPIPVTRASPLAAYKPQPEAPAATQDTITEVVGTPGGSKMDCGRAVLRCLQKNLRPMATGVIADTLWRDPGVLNKPADFVTMKTRVSAACSLLKHKNLIQSTPEGFRLKEGA